MYLTGTHDRRITIEKFDLLSVVLLILILLEIRIANFYELTDSFYFISLLIFTLAAIFITLTTYIVYQAIKQNFYETVQQGIKENRALTLALFLYFLIIFLIKIDNNFFTYFIYLSTFLFCYISIQINIKILVMIGSYLVKNKLLQFIIGTIILSLIFWVATMEADLAIQKNLLLPSYTLPRSQDALSFLLFIRLLLLLLIMVFLLSAWAVLYSSLLLPIVVDICKFAKNRFAVFNIDEKNYEALIDKVEFLTIRSNVLMMRYILFAMALIIINSFLVGKISNFISSSLHSIVLYTSFFENNGQCKNISNGTFIYFIENSKIIVAKEYIQNKTERYAYHKDECIKQPLSPSSVAK